MKRHLFIFISCTALQATQEYAWISVPVADLFNSHNGQETELASCKKAALCTRINQALFNECYRIEKKGERRSAISIPWAVYGYEADGKPQNSYWIDNENFETVSPEKPTNFLIPTLHRPKTVTLLQPFTDAQGNKFSLGTEFVTNKAGQIIYQSPTTKKITRIDLTTLKTTPYRASGSRKQFINLLTQFVDEHNKQNKTIAYVWGGSSFTHAYSSAYTQDANGFYRTDRTSQQPLSGYDCSNLLLRFTHIAQVPYIFKTTAMLEKYGKPLRNQDSLQEGDLIWLQGHVVIITSLKHHLVTESCGYDLGVGKVRTIKLNKLLQDINTWTDLVHAYKKQRIVTRLDAQGNPGKQTPVKLFKLPAA